MSAFFPYFGVSRDCNFSLSPCGLYRYQGIPNCPTWPAGVMGDHKLLNLLPDEVLCKVLHNLPVSDRALLEAVSKRIYDLSRNKVTEVKFTLRSIRDVSGILAWLTKVQNGSCETLSCLKLTKSARMARDNPLGKDAASSRFVSTVHPIPSNAFPYEPVQ